MGQRPVREIHERRAVLSEGTPPGGASTGRIRGRPRTSAETHGRLAAVGLHQFLAKGLEDGLERQHVGGVIIHYGATRRTAANASLHSGWRSAVNVSVFICVGR